MTNKKPLSRGLIVSYFGDGKGKTTAALGVALRASGHKKKILIIQFIKGNWRSGEERGIKPLKEIEMIKTGLGFVGIEGDCKDIALHRKAAAKGLQLAEKALLKKYDVIILDEIFGAVRGGLIKESDIIELLNKKSENLHLILTGTPRINSIIRKSDLVTQMKKIKHPYDKGQLAIEGIDY